MKTTPAAVRLSSSLSSSSSVVLSVVVGATGVLVWYVAKRTRVAHSPRLQKTTCAYESLIGNTPLVKLERLSALIGRSIHVKMESLNPGFSGKDRAALSMIRRAEEFGNLPPPMDLIHGVVSPHMARRTRKVVITRSRASSRSDCDELESILQKAMTRSRTGGLVVEGTSGSTGISLATLCAARGHACVVVLPDDQASEKQAILRTMGAVVHVVPCCAISNPNHYVNIARCLAEMAHSQFGIEAVFVDQFENKANFHVHYTVTGPELWRQCPQLDAFVMSSGTGGTIAGVATFLKEQTRGRCRIVLVDPPGSALYHRVHHGVAYAPQQRERALKRHRYDTLAEGIGLDRMTVNFRLGVDLMDDAIRVSDQEAVDMAHWLLHNEGLWVGSSSAMNVVGAIQVACRMSPSSTVVTVICDSGQRHVTRFWNEEFIKEWGLVWPGDKKRMPACLQSFSN